jgi:hypothetical protein
MGLLGALLAQLSGYLLERASERGRFLPTNSQETKGGSLGIFGVFWLEGFWIYGSIKPEEPSLSWVSYLVSSTR